MRIGIIIPDRGDRPEFLKHCLKMMDNQSIKPFVIRVVDFPPSNNECDISKRYRLGYDALSNFYKLDLIAFVENDDWYSSKYLANMIEAWQMAGEPDLFGTRSTIYYHLKLKAWYLMQHESRSSAMNILIKPNLNFPWPVDHEPFTDVWLWDRPEFTKHLWSPPELLSIGMKHGVGKTGGKSHVDRLHRYTNEDDEMGWLKLCVDADSYNFYREYSKQLNKN